METRLITLSTSGADHDVCHLLEHLILNIFSARQQEKYRLPLHNGWVRGRTIDDQIFFDVGAFNDSYIDEFMHTLTNMPLLDEQIVQHELARIECEMREEIGVPSMSKLIDALNILAGQVLSKQPKLPQTKGLLSIRANSRCFRDILIHIEARHINTNGRKLFLWMDTVILDIIEERMRNLAAYVGATSVLYPEGGWTGLGQRWTVKTHQSAAGKQALERALNHIIRQIDVDTLYPVIHRYFKAYASHDLYHDLPIEYFRQTGLLVSTSELLELADKRTVKDTLRGITIEVSPWRAQFDEYEWR